LVLWLNQVTRRFCGEPPQTPRADSGRELLPCTSSCPRLCLDFFATMRPALDPAGHLVTRADPTCLSTPRGPARHRPCMSALPLHQRKSRRNLHLQYSAKSQSTPHCQSLLTASSDHPPVLGRSCPQREREREILVKKHNKSQARVTTFGKAQIKDKQRLSWFSYNYLLTLF
jgi:hypothetical protein